MTHRKRRKSPTRISIPADVQNAYSTLQGELNRAHQAAAQASPRNPQEALDLRGALKLLNDNPQLVRYLDGVRQREEARSQALGQSIPAAVSYAVPGMEEGFYGVAQKKTGSPTQSTPQAGGSLGGWTTGGTKDNTPIGVANANILRYMADNNEWVRAAINIRRQQIGRADIAVVPDNEKKPWDRNLMKQIQRLLDQPNEYRDSYRSLIEPVIEDILVLDRGVISKDMSPKRTPLHLYYEDGATIKIYTTWDGNPRKPRYLFEEPGSTRKVPLFNDELICITANPATYRVGLSPVQYLMKTIKAEMRAIESATHLVDMKPPPHIVQVPGAHQTQITHLRNSYDAEIAGRKELFWIGGDAEARVFPLTFSARDNQWLEWQQYLARKIATAFQISPQQLGFTQDINRSNGEIQQEIYEDTGLIPLLLLLEEYLNRELVLDFAKIAKDGRADLESLNLRVIYPQISEYERALHYEKAAKFGQLMMPGMPTATLNQLLLMRGEEPVPGGNTFWVNSPTLGPMPWLSYDQEYGDWTPLGALGGMLGAQDSMGGPSEQEDPKDTSDAADKQSAKREQQQQQAKTPAANTGKTPPKTKKPSDNSPKGGDSSNGNGDAPNFQEAKQYDRRTFDRRRPGHHSLLTNFYLHDYDEGQP